MPHRGAAPNASTSRQAQLRTRDVKDIIKRRDAAMSKARRLREHNASSRFVEKVQQLLTRWWATANWQALEELLKTADWLISLEKRSQPKLQPGGETRT